MLRLNKGIVKKWSLNKGGDYKWSLKKRESISRCGV